MSENDNKEVCPFCGEELDPVFGEIPNPPGVYYKCGTSTFSQGKTYTRQWRCYRNEAVALTEKLNTWKEYIEVAALTMDNLIRVKDEYLAGNGRFTTSQVIYGIEGLRGISDKLKELGELP